MPNTREKLIELLAKYFDIGDSYAYNLTRDKQAFMCGTMGFDDFEEFDEETVTDIADHLIANGVTVQNTKFCDYCQEDADGYRKMMGSCSITNPFHGSSWQISIPHNRPIQIFYCPICGRKLDEPPKGE